MQPDPSTEQPTQPAQAVPDGAAIRDEPDMLLIFTLSSEVFGISVNWIHEIIDPLPVTPVPNAPPSSIGLINVRGVIVPLIDVRQRLGMEVAETTSAARVIVIELAVDGEQTKLALLADSVEEVAEADLSAPEPVPPLGAKWPAEFIRGAVRRDDTLIIILETETVFSAAAGGLQHQ